MSRWLDSVPPKFSKPTSQAWRCNSLNGVQNRVTYDGLMRRLQRHFHKRMTCSAALARCNTMGS